MPDKLRHAYRSLLRATTYLPDSAARTYIHNHIVASFRSVANKIKFRVVNGQRIGHLIYRYHRDTHINKVWQKTRHLERAADCNIAELEKILYITYGRAGKRRRELVQQLLLTEEHALPQDESALSDLISGRPEENNPKKHQPTSKIHAFLRSQQANHPIATSKPKIRNLVPQIPKETLWGRPVPLSRQKRMRKRFWADILDKVLPPVPEHEWNRLRDFATGAIPIEDLPPLRGRGLRRNRPSGKQLAPPEIRLYEYFTTPTRLHKSEVDENSAELDMDTRIRRKFATPRYMRRLYGTIWSLTPTMSQDATTMMWTTKWGGGRSASDLGQVTAPSTSDMELFEGTNDEVQSSPATQNRQSRKRKPSREEAPSAPPEKAYDDDSGNRPFKPAISRELWTNPP